MTARRLSDRVVILALGGAAQSLVQAVIGLVLVRLFDDQETFGSYRQVWLVLNTLIPFFQLGLIQAIYYFLPSLPANLHRAFMSRCLFLLSLSGLVTSLGLFVLAHPVAQLFANPGIAPLLRAVSFYPLFAIPSLTLFQFLVTVDRHSRAVGIDLGLYLAQAAMIITLAALAVPLSALFRAVTALAAVRLVWSVVEIGRHTRGPVLAPLPVRLRDEFAYAVPAWLSALTNTLGRHLDKLLVSGILGVTRYAVYSVGALEFPGMLLVSAASNTVLRPHIATLHHRGSSQEICDVWQEAFRKQALAILPMAAFLAVFAHEFIELLYTVQYGDAALPFQIYLALAVFLIAPHEVVLTSIGRTRTVFYGTVLSLGVNLALSLLLIGPLEMAGPPLATVLARVALVAVYSRSAARALYVPRRHFLPVGILLRVGFIAGCAVALASPAKLLGVGHFGTLAVGGVVFSAAYFLIAWRARALTSDDLMMLRRWLTLEPLRTRKN